MGFQPWSLRLRLSLSVLLFQSLVVSGVHAQAPQANDVPSDAIVEQPPSSATKAPSFDQEPPPPDAKPAPNPYLRLGPGDLVEVSVYNVPDLTTRARISSTGDVYLPLIDYVHIGGLTAEEAQPVIEKRLADGGFVKDPHVSIFVTQYTSQSVSVLGEVEKPGVYPVMGEQRLLDVISAAGGFSDKAGRSVTLTHRNEPDKPTTIQLAREIGDDPDSNVKILPGDTLVVRRADIVYVVGEVTRPAGFLMERGTLTVLQAIALAGGATSTAKLNGARIVRKGASGMSETPLQLKKMLEAKLPDVTLQPDDILFVPASQRKILGKRGMEAAVQAATAVTIYSLRF